MLRKILTASTLVFALSWAAGTARAACDYDIGGAPPYTMTELEADLDEELACLTIGSGTQAFDTDLGTFAAGSWTDPNLDQFMFWDDSQGRMEFATIADLTTEAAPTTGDYLVLYGAEGDARKVDWSSLPGVGGGISNIVEDATPQLGGTLDTNGNAIEFGTAATDTSVVRSGAGDLTIEGNVVYRAGGTDVPLADGGTGASLSDPGADRLMFWDDSATETAYMTLGTAYATSTTTLRSPTESFCVAASDETTAITTGTAKVTFRMPYAFTLTNIRGSLNTVSSSGSPLIDINEAGTSVATTNKLLIDVSEETSVSAATAITITDTSLADDAEMTIDIDTAGTGAKGLKVCLIGYQT